MLSLFTRRVALSTYRSNAIYSRILPSSGPALCNRRIPDVGLHTRNARTSTSPRRNASTKATVTTKKTEPSTKSSTTGRKKHVIRLTPQEQEARRQRLWAEKELARKRKAERAVALRTKRKAQAEKEKEAAATKRKRLAEKKKKLAEATKAEEMKKEMEKRNMIKPPPRRMNSFALFAEETKKTLRETAILWNNLPDEAKEEYDARAQVLAEERRKAFNAFAGTVSKLDIMRYNRVQRSKGKHPIRIKHDAPRPLTGFMAYARECRNRPEHAGKHPVEVAKVAGAGWRSLTQEEKDRYKSKPTESSTV